MKKTNRNELKQLRARKIAKILGNVFIGLILLCGLLVAFSLLPVKDNYKLYAVMSGSMTPKLPVGSLVVVKPKATYKIGDVITFTSGASNKDKTTHRIYAITNSEGQQQYTTKGDANNAPDEKPVSRGQILGKQFIMLPYMGYVLNYIQTPFGLVLIILVPSVIIIYEEFRKIMNEIKEITKRKRERKAKK